MRNSPVQIALVFIGLVLLQVLVLNNFQIFGYINPKVYILFVLTLPNKMNNSILLLLAFAMGLTIDIFENSGGIHASATLLLAFVRPFLLRIVKSKSGADFQTLNLSRLGLQKFVAYAGLGTLIHHLWLFSLEAFSFQNPLLIIYETLVSGMFTLVLIIIIELLFNRKAD